MKNASFRSFIIVLLLGIVVITAAPATVSAAAWDDPAEPGGSLWDRLVEWLAGFFSMTAVWGGDDLKVPDPAPPPTEP